MKNLKSLAIIGSHGMVGYEKAVGIDRKNYEQYNGKHFDTVFQMITTKEL